MGVQYIVGISWGLFNTWGDIMSTSGGYHEYIEGCSIHIGYHDSCGGAA